MTHENRNPGAATDVLLVGAGFGHGHNRSARAIGEALARGWPGLSIDFVDYLDALPTPIAAMGTAGYVAVTKYWPRAYGMLHDLSAQLAPRPTWNELLGGVGRDMLMQVLAAKRPRAVVATHPWPATVIARARHEGITMPPTLLAATDFSLHPQWVQPGLDHYCVPTPDAALMLMQGGIPPSRVTVTGIPIRRAFQEFERTRPNVPTVLLVGSAQGGLGGIPVACKRLLLQIAPARLEVVVGADRWLKTRLQQRRTFRRSDRLVVHGYVPDLADLLCHADVMVTKGGGVTLAEALATGVPLVVYRAIPGHEVDNAAWLEREGAAVVARHPVELAAEVASVLAHPERRRSLADNARRLARPLAADDVAHLAAGLLQARSPS